MKKGGLYDGAGSEADDVIFRNVNGNPHTPIDSVTGEVLMEETEENQKGNETKREDISTLLGIEFQGFKGQAAIDKLLTEQQVHVKGAFHREGMAEIDLIWGNNDIGLKHIIQQRTQQGIDIKKFLSSLTDTIENGTPKISKRGNIEILKDNQIAVVQLEFKGNKLNFIVTAYKTRKASW